LGILLSPFLWPYVFLVPVSGWLVDRWNVHRVMTAGFFLWSTATAVTVQGILRHAKIRTTLDLYTQEDSEESEAAQGQFLQAVMATGALQ
jgi:MFS family permease